MMSQQRLPEGWDEDRVQRVIAHYENQSDEEAAAEDEAFWAAQQGECLVSVPRPLVPAIEAIIQEYEAAKAAAAKGDPHEPAAAKADPQEPAAARAS